MPVQYFYFNSRTPNPATGAPIIAAGPLVIPKAVPVLPLTDNSNPIYNMSNIFIQKMQKITSHDMTVAVPLISLVAMDANGEIRTDFSKKYFNKTVNLNKVGSQRFGERPDMSMQHITVSSNLGTGTGMIVFNEIEIAIRLHKPSSLSNEELVNLMKPGMPLRLRYGWSCSTNDFLSTQALELFNIREYQISFDAQGEATLVVQGSTHNEDFANIYIGDQAVVIPDVTATQAAQKETQGTSDAGNVQLDGVAQKQVRIDSYFTYADAMAVRDASDPQSGRPQATMDNIAMVYSSLAERVSSAVEANFSAKTFQLADQIKSDPVLFPDQKVKDRQGNVHQGEYVTLHDIMSVLCGSTLDAMLGKVTPANRDYRVVYGPINENCGSYSGKSLAETPIHWRSLGEQINTAQNSGIRVPSIQWLINTLGSRFLRNDSYWRGTLCAGVTQIDTPKVNVLITAHQIQGREIIQLSFVDTNQGVPLTQKLLKEAGQQLWTQQAQQNTVLNNQNIPVIRIGHANAFVKSISLSHHNDPALRAVLIKRLTEEQVTNQRQSITRNTRRPAQEKNSLYLPLTGEMELVGHVDWKPSRYFYLNSGVYFIDGMYVITAVSHHLDAAGYTTQISFVRH